MRMKGKRWLLTHLMPSLITSDFENEFVKRSAIILAQSVLFITTSNFILNMIIGGSLSQLWGAVRMLQVLLLQAIL